MATALFVDPLLNSDSGSGTLGDPYGDLEYCLEQEDWVSGGIQVNVRDTATEIIAAELSVAMADVSAPGKTVAWTPTEDDPLIFRGYTSAADDGGVATISGGGSVGILVNTAISYVHFVDLRLTNSGAAAVCQVDNYCSWINCEIDTTTSFGVDVDTGGYFDRCYIHDCGGNYALAAQGGASHIRNSIIVSDGNTNGAVGLFNGSSFERNIVIVNETGVRGVYAIGEQIVIDHNSVYSSVANTTAGIEVQAARLIDSIKNNLIEGFSGVGGKGIQASATAHVRVTGGNSVYNCETAINLQGDVYSNFGGNESLGQSPFTDAANNDFSPVDTGSVKEGAVPASFPII